MTSPGVVMEHISRIRLSRFVDDHSEEFGSKFLREVSAARERAGRECGAGMGVGGRRRVKAGCVGGYGGFVREQIDLQFHGDSRQSGLAPLKISVVHPGPSTDLGVKGSCRSGTERLENRAGAARGTSPKADPLALSTCRARQRERFALPALSA